MIYDLMKGGMQSNCWLFPLYGLDLRPLQVDRKELKEEQQAEANRFYDQF